LGFGRSVKRLERGDTEERMVSIAGLARIVDPAARSQARSDRSRALICDRRFAHRLNELHNIKNFLYEEKVKFDSDKIAEVDLGVLNQLYYGGGGRLPSADEWALLDEKLCVLVSYLDDNLRRKLRIRELGLFFWSIPLAFLIFAILSTGFALCFLSLLDAHTAAYTISFVLTLFAWTISQGGLGACAFLGTSVIARSVEETRHARAGHPSVIPMETSEIIDRNFLKSRILLGALFGFLIGLPFSYFGLKNISDALFLAEKPLSFDQLVYVLIPFMVGFSTNLVLVLLNRMFFAIQTFFGLPTRS